ncbi:MAG: YgjV family protein [Sphingobacteriales bacterium]|nr:YgjV family protein [Sphingobacteriales bacterium]MBI3718400.1 YgjV family protein [Sphingobacteriales bacterium]
MIQQLAPWFGYLASVLLALGLLVSNDLKFRWLNGSGCLAFIIYGVIIGAIPVILTNTILLIINIIWLYKIYTRHELFELLEFNEGGIMIDRFLSFYKDDIAGYFPDFKREQLEGNLNFVVLRDLVVANMFSAKTDENGNAKVVINYTVPKFRDYKIGPFIFDKEKKVLTSKGIKKVYYTSVANNQHKKFLKTTGFTNELLNGQGCLVKNL